MKDFNTNCILVDVKKKEDRFGYVLLFCNYIGKTDRIYTREITLNLEKNGSYSEESKAIRYALGFICKFSAKSTAAYDYALLKLLVNNWAKLREYKPMTLSKKGSKWYMTYIKTGLKIPYSDEMVWKELKKDNNPLLQILPLNIVRTLVSDASIKLKDIIKCELDEVGDLKLTAIFGEFGPDAGVTDKNMVIPILAELGAQDDLIERC